MTELKLTLSDRDADDRASRLVSAVIQQRRREADGQADLHLFHAPSECYRDVARQDRREMTDLLKAWGVTPDEYNTLLDERLSRKYAYFNHLYVEPDDVYMVEFEYPDEPDVDDSDADGDNIINGHTVYYHKGRPCYWH